MASDLQSIQSSGGVGAAPKTFRPEDFSSGPAVFRPSTPGGNKGTPSVPRAPAVKVVAPSGARHTLLVILGIIIFLAIAGAVVYFFLWPLLFPAAPTSTPPAAVTTPSTQPVAPPTSLAGLTSHQSFFTAPVSPSAQISLNLSLPMLQVAVAAAAADSQPAGTFKEISFTSGGKPFTAQDFLGLALPGLAKDFLTDTFEQDLTGFVYYDQNGSWPGYVFKVKAGSDVDTAKSTVGPILEAAPAGFFAVSPGAPKDSVFDDGALPDGKAVRLMRFTKKGSALEYGWFGNYLTVSTSYQGLIEAVKRLGV
jgi:hypothetical protein